MKMLFYRNYYFTEITTFKPLADAARRGEERR